MRMRLKIGLTRALGSLRAYEIQALMPKNFPVWLKGFNMNGHSTRLILRTGTGQYCRQAEKGSRADVNVHISREATRTSGLTIPISESEHGNHRIFILLLNKSEGPRLSRRYQKFSYGNQQTNPRHHPIKSK